MEGMDKFYAALGKKCLEAYNNGAPMRAVCEDATKELVSKGARFKAGDRVFCFLGGNRIEISPVEVVEVTFRDGMFQYATPYGRLAESGLYESEEEALEAMQAFINTRKG